MRIDVRHVLLGLFFAVATPAGVHCIQAQDASYPLQESLELDTERERVIYSPGETADPSINTKSHILSPKDSMAIRHLKTAKAQSEQPKNSSRPASQEDDSILSFNFLYYIFEKYKLQDVVE